MPEPSDRFTGALLSVPKRRWIPEADDWFAPLLGDWVFDYSEPGGRRLKGEWYFRRALEGTAIEDIFICPSRDTKEQNPQPDGEYGAALRMYCPERRCYDMTYVCTKYTRRLEVRREKNTIVCTVLDRPCEQWQFTEITGSAFHWQNVTLSPEGVPQLNCEVFAVRL